MHADRSFLAWLISCALLAGCGTLTSRHPAQFIIVHPEGYAIGLDRREVADFDDQVWEPILAGIDAYVENSNRQGQPARLFVYVHGGLTTYQGGLDELEKFRTAQAQQELYPHLAGHHLLFVNWDSSLLTSVIDDLFVIRLGRRSPLWGVPSSPFVVGQRVTSSGLGMPQSLGLQASNARDSLVVRERERWPWCELADSGGAEGTGWVVSNAGLFAALYPLRAATVPAIQGFGPAAWDTMKRRAELVMAPRLPRPRECDRGLDDRCEGGGRLLLDALRRHIPQAGQWTTREKAVRPLNITLVGHSMGTMVLNHLLQDFSDVFFDRIIYLAAAAAMDDVRGAVFPYLDRHPETTFWAFSLSETREASEWNIVDVIERGSLLVWIDHYLERINKPGDRTFGRAKNLRNHLADHEVEPRHTDRRQIILVKFGNGRDDPERHADLNDPGVVERALALSASEECR